MFSFSVPSREWERMDLKTVLYHLTVWGKVAIIEIKYPTKLVGIEVRRYDVIYKRQIWITCND